MSNSESVFNAEAFLGIITESAGSTQYFPVPQGEYQGQIKKVDARRIESKKEPGTFYTLLELVWHILGEEAKKATEVDEPLARQTFFLDLTPQGGLDFGKNKNVPLARLRDVLNQNKQGKKWGPAHLLGQTAWVQVGHDVNEETGEPRAVIKKVGRDAKPAKAA